MPRKNPLPNPEQQICRRLATARKDTGLSRTAAARKAGIDSSQLRRYEDGLSPLRYFDAKRLCAALNIPMPWLAGSDSAKKPAPIFGDVDFTSELNERSLFSTVFDKHLRRRFDSLERVASRHATLGVGTIFRVESNDDMEMLFSAFPTALKRVGKSAEVIQPLSLVWLAEPEDADTSEFAWRRRALLAAGTDPLLATQIALSACREQQRFNERLAIVEAERSAVAAKRGVDESAKTDIVPGVPTSLLKELLRKAARLAPTQSALAKAIGVERQRVNDWMTDKSLPNGETTLRLSAWVAEIEGNQTKTAAVRLTPRRRKTRQTNT